LPSYGQGEGVDLHAFYRKGHHRCAHEESFETRPERSARRQCQARRRHGRAGEARQYRG
ncbi:hypothetical protein KEM55_000629, partial [Ascosphaera atra]